MHATNLFSRRWGFETGGVQQPLAAVAQSQTQFKCPENAQTHNAGDRESSVLPPWMPSTLRTTVRVGREQPLPGVESAPISRTTPPNPLPYLGLATPPLRLPVSP